MITTFGRRRSASATADAPSVASPIDADARRAREREAKALTDDFVVVSDEARDLVGHGAILRRGFG